MEFSKVYHFLLGALAIGGTANTFRRFNKNLKFCIQRELAVPPITPGALPSGTTL